MDIILNFFDRHLLTPYVYPPIWSEDDIYRQTLSLFTIMTLAGYFSYFITSTLSYRYLFDKRLQNHPHYLHNQIRREILHSCQSIPFLVLINLPFFVAEVRGYSKLYLGEGEAQALGLPPFVNRWPFVLFTAFSFLMFTDCLIYWIHRGLHYRGIYRALHKSHHQIRIPTPFAGYAFNPLDAGAQGLPYQIYPFLFPVHKGLFLMLYLFINVWSVLIHDGAHCVPKVLEPLINGTIHHTDHHSLFVYNYGQFFTLWDQLGGSYNYPTSLSEDCVLQEAIRATEAKKKAGKELKQG
jgi:lathosterol oxidase